MKKAILGLVAVVALGGALVGCGPTGGEKTIEVLVQTADHGWTGAVQSYAAEKVAEINAAGKYKVNLTACDNATQENQKIDDLLTAKDSLHGIVMLPIDNTVESGITKIVDAGVPFVQFDRIVSTEKIDNAASRVSNVLGDNYGIGVATAERFIEKGLKAGDPILIMPGDNSSVPVSRNQGFKDTLVSKGGWTQEQVDAIASTDYTGWSRTESSKLFESRNDITSFNWIFTHDSEIAMGILESLNSTRVSDDVKAHFKNGGIKSLASSSGLDEMYAVLEDQHKAEYDNLLADSCDLFDVTYDPAMIQQAIQDLVDHLDGKTVAKNHVIPVSVVDSANVGSFRGFGKSDTYRK
jgi:ribose transport system substrate-binding protein